MFLDIEYYCGLLRFPCFYRIFVSIYTTHLSTAFFILDECINLMLSVDTVIYSYISKKRIYVDYKHPLYKKVNIYLNKTHQNDVFNLFLNLCINKI